ncbi:uncharacterized protein LOC116033331 [Ipomoea triloba]|uniref:uncharacterized protein LOC116033331 n=1 Tax=Ipomoea triloba TaxID=35885 RepID=UPI00125E5781|nr:uncharacterized protein LOC116033331 [Ipomoea triloba]
MEVLPFLRGHDLINLVDGSCICPPEFLTAVSDATSSAAATRVRNLAYVAWFRRDQELLSLLVSSLLEEVLSIAVGCRTSKELWDAIEQSLASASQSRQLHLLSQLHGLRQGDSLTAEYLGRARLIVEDLALAGRNVMLEEQNLYVFRGLRPEFKGVTSSLAVRGHPMTLLELADLLGAQDFIAGDDYALPGGAAPAAFTAQGGRQSRGRGGGRSAGGSPFGRGGSASAIVLILSPSLYPFSEGILKSPSSLSCLLE